jgi:hypothetical protein
MPWSTDLKRAGARFVEPLMIKPFRPIESLPEFSKLACWLSVKLALARIRSGGKVVRALLQAIAEESRSIPARHKEGPPTG